MTLALSDSDSTRGQTNDGHTSDDTTTKKTDDDNKKEIECKACGRTFKSNKGLGVHSRTCKTNSETSKSPGKCERNYS